MAFDLAHIIHYLLIHRPLGFLLLHPFKSILQNPVVRVGWGFLQSGNSSNHLRLSLSLSPSSFLSLHVLNPPLVTSHRAPICAVIRPNPACRLGRNIIKTILCCHGNRDLNKFIFFMCVFSGLGIWLVCWLVWMSGSAASCSSSVFSHPTPACSVFIYLVIKHQERWFSITIRAIYRQGAIPPVSICVYTEYTCMHITICAHCCIEICRSRWIRVRY